MDSRPRGLPFSVSRSRTSYTSSPSTYTSSPLLSSSRLYGRDRVLTSDRLPRSSTPFKPDLCQQRYRNLIEESPPWLEPLPTLNSSRDWPWAESPASIRSKQTDSERRTGTYSGLLKVNDDSDFKRAKLSYGSRDTRTSSTSVTAPSYSNIGTGEKTSSWRSYSSTLSPSSTSYSSPSSKPLLTRRDVLNRHLREPEESRYSSHLSSLGESRRRTSALTSLYEPDRLTSSYAQGARPKEPIYSSSSSSTARESYRPRYFPSLDHSARTTADTLSPSSSTITTSSLRSSTITTSSLRSSTTPTSSLRSSTTPTSSLRSSTSGLRSAQEQTRNPVSPTVASSPSSSRSSWYTSSVARQDSTSLSKPLTTAAPAPQRPAPAGAEPEGRRSLLSRIFSRRSSQDSSGLSSGSSSRSFDSSDGSPPTGVEAAARTPNVTTPEPLALASDRLRRRFFDAVNTPEVAAPESDTAQHLTSHRLRRRFFDTPRSDGDGGGHATWFSSYLRNRSAPPPPPPSSEGSGDGIKEASSSRQNTHRRWADKAPDEDEDDEEDEEEKEDSEAGGASGVTAASVAGSSRVYMQPMPATFRNPGFGSSATPTVTVYPNAFVVGRSQAEAQEKDKHVASRDPERLRKIQERLMLEESDEDEGDLCRICQMGEDSASNPLIEPCHCTGSLQFVHQECIKTWLHSKISSGAGLEALTTCELCKEKLHLNIDNFNIHELHRTHEQSEYEFIRSGLYLVVLLHLYEQRFSDEAGVRTHAAHSTLSPLLASLDEYLDIRVERLPGESDDDDEVVVDNRPRIDFSDLDDDLEDED